MQHNEETWLLNEKYHGEKTEGFFADCERLKNGAPLAYLIGHVPFLNTTIYLDSHPLIPRAETEYWVEKVLTEISLGRMSLGQASGKVLDLCAGSGCIGIAVLKAIPTARVDFCEIDPCHHTTIIKNVEHNISDPTRARIFSGDLFEHITDTYDLIVSNPPYIDATLGRAEVSVLAHEPHTALFGGQNGFEIIRRIITSAPRFLAESGVLVLEHEPEQSDSIHAEVAGAGFKAITHSDQFDTERYTYLTRIPIENMSR